MKFLKLAIALVGISASLLSTQAKKSVPLAAAMQPLNDDFIVGFETGIFLRKTPDQLEEYGCPQASIKMAEFQKVKKMWPSVSQIIQSMND